MPRTQSDLRFAVFARAWAVTVLLGLLSQEMATTPGRILVTGSATAVLCFARSPWLLGALAVSYVGHFAADGYRHVYVHVWLLFLASCALGVGLLTTWNADAVAWRARFVRGVAPVLVALGAAWLFFAGFAKLNTSFSDPAVSCGPIFFAHQRTVFPFSLLPGGPWAEAVVIPVTQVAETLGGLLLLHHRTRKAGFLLAWPFLFLAGTNPLGRLYEFTALFLALFTLGFQWRWPFSRPLACPSKIRTALCLLLIAGVVATARLDAPGPGLELRYRIGWGLFVVAALALVLAVAFFSSAVPLRGPGPPFAKLAWVVFALAVLHETLPYLGLRNARNVAMAANLSVNRFHSNHRIVVRAPSLPFNHTAVLRASSDPFLASHRGYAWVDWALFDYLGRHPAVRVRFELDGETVTVPRAGDDPRFQPSAVAAFLAPFATDTRDVPTACGKTRPKKARTVKR
jgi:hypothetical protein